MKLRVMSCVLSGLLMLASVASAQQGTSEIRGKVLDTQGASVPGVTVTVRNQETGMFRDAVSNADGTYFVSGIVPGLYELSANLQGFKKYSRRDVSLEIGKTATVDVRLEIGTMEEMVTVVADSPIVDVTSKEVGGRVTARELVELPSVNRNFVGFVGLLPGIIPSISTESFGSDSVTVNGQDARNNNYMLDGGNNNDDVIGQRAGTQARTPIEAVQEFQVLTNQFDAEFGRTAGAIINAVTKQGTNQLRGSAFVFGQDASLTNKDFFAKRNNNPKPDTSQWQWGGTVGGPIVQNKAHFFGSLERTTIDEGITVNVPARPDLNGTTTDADARVEHHRALRSPGEREPHVGRPLAARVLAAVQPGHRRRRCSTCRARGRRPGPDGRRHRQFRAEQQHGQHAARRLDAGRRGLRQLVLQRRTDECKPTVSPRSPSRPSPISRAPSRRLASTTRSRLKTRCHGSCRTSAATTTSSSGSSTSTHNLRTTPRTT